MQSGYPNYRTLTIVQIIDIHQQVDQQSNSYSRLAMFSYHLILQCDNTSQMSDSGHHSPLQQKLKHDSHVKEFLRGGGLLWFIATC